MFLNFIKLLTFLAFIVPASMQQNCENSICNYEAPCKLNKDGNPACECVEQFFQGEFCSESKEHCSPNPCQNGGTCQSYPGHYNCECSPGFSGQKCTLQQDAFKGLHLHYNHIAPIGSEQSLILIIQHLGTVETLMEFYTPDYIIDGIMFTPTAEHFIKSNDLKVLAKDLGIKHSDSLPYASGLYRISKASFWKLGINSMTLDLSDFGPSGESFFRGQFDIFVYDPTDSSCFPSIHLPHCLNPRKPLHLDMQTFNFIEPIVDKRCKQGSIFRIKWGVKNYINTVSLHKFRQQPGTDLTIPPYTMWFNYSDDFLQSYLIQGDVVELDASKSQISKTTIRCYVFVDSKPTTASIFGGPYREINHHKEFILDGSISRDYARRPGRNQYLQYSWSCSSDDVENHFCKQNMGNESRLIIPAQSLQLHGTYKFNLLVRSTINIYSTHRTYQTIKAVSHDSLFIHFICLRNCQHGKFSAGKIIHLKVQCIKCPSGDPTYKVYDELGTEVASNQRVILDAPPKQEVFLKAEASLGSLRGETSIKLTLNQPPSRGECFVSPLSGIEYQTLFKISCPGYEDEDKPIDYKFSVGNHVLDHSGDETLTTRLFPTSGEVCEIRISICDDIGACIEVSLRVSLKPISNSMGSWADLLSQNETNLRALIQSGDKSSAFILLRTVVSHMAPSDHEAIVKHVVECFRNVEAERLLVVEQFLTLANNLLTGMSITSETALLISELFLKVSKGFSLAIRNSEVLELQVETHGIMMGDLAESMASTAIEAEEFPLVHDAEPIPPEDPFKENYPDYGELNIEDVVRISNWLKSQQRMHRCLQVMGVVSAFVLLPGEAPLVTKRKGVTSISLVVDNSQDVPLSWNHSKTSVDLPKKFLKNLGRNEVTIQVSIFESNPLWWNPEQHMINTEVLSIGAYSKSLASLTSKSTRSYFSFYMQIKGSPDEIPTHGILQNELEMLVFERLLPENSLLVVTFVPVRYDLSVLLLMEERPRRVLMKDAIVVRASAENISLYLVNNKSKKRSAFLAISSKFRVEFSFTMTIKMCANWDTRVLEWTSKYCFVGDQTNATHIHCSCWHLSMFGAKVYPTFGHVQASKDLVDHLAINFGMLSAITSIIILLLMLLWLAWRRDVHAAENTVILEDICVDREGNFEYFVTIYTNGHTHAGTTSNITLQLNGSLSRSQRLTLYSSTTKPIFHRNAQTSFNLLLPNDLGILESVALNHDGFGRYPMWNCQMVTISDEERKNQYIFVVNKWILANSAPILIPLAKEQDILQSRRFTFKNVIENLFANFYAEQSFSSVRLYGQLSALERSSAFILKSSIMVMGTLVYFGKTTILTYEVEREMYYSMLLRFSKILFIACVCHLIGVVLVEGLFYLMLWIKRRKSNLKYKLVLR